MGIEENEEMDEFDTVTLEMEDGSEVEFAILDEFEMETEKFVLLGEISCSCSVGGCLAAYLTAVNALPFILWSADISLADGLSRKYSFGE